MNRIMFRLWEPGYDIFVLWFRSKSSSCRLPYQHHSSSADCTRELFKGSDGSDSLLDGTRKKIFGSWVQIFCDWHHKWSSFWAILAPVAWPRVQPLDQNISLKFSLETRLESESFEPLIDFLAFLVKKLWSEINKLINYLIRQKFLLTQIITSEPETTVGYSKYQKTRIVAWFPIKTSAKYYHLTGWRPGPGEVG